MDSINKEATKCYKSMQFASLGSEPANYKAVSITTFSNGANCENLTLDPQSLLKFAATEPPAGSECFFRLVCFTFDYRKVLQSSRNVFDQVYVSFKLEHGAKYLLYHRATGIHMFKPHDDHLSFYLGMVSLRLLYTYHIPSKSTRGIVVSDAHTLHNELWEFMTMPDLVGRLVHSANLAPHPHFIPCVCAVSLMVSIRRATEQAFSGGNALSLSGGTDIWATRVEALSRTSSMDMMKMAKVSDLIMPMLWEFQHIKRFCIVAEEIQQVIQDGAGIHLLDKTDCILKDAAEEINEVVKLVKGQIASETSKITYWLERGWSQMNTVFSTATRADALASINLAKKASDDSSSMRIVAIMTMTFLPGTFFAALFAVPSLDWRDDAIVTGKFWVYWAFTIPSTVAVFMLWFILTKRNSYQ